MDRETSPVVLVVDDERDLADLFTAWLSDDYTVRTAYSGQEALDSLDDAIDVVLLDRRMPDLSGDAVLSEVRERDLDCRVAMVTAVDPDFDIVEMGFDAYLTKPVTNDDLHDVVETLLTRKHHDTAVQQYFQLVTKRAALDAQYGDDAADDPQYEALQAEIDSLEREVETLASEFDEDDFEVELHRIEQDGVDAGREADADVDGGTDR
ncbi:receiver box response regulator [Halobacterium hubeiense]|uniref:Receiver box response regulator n=1 Tax=Halobacterium hubeiense TaxID=1407499 RepID=A0A0U5CXL0_9EURY|nr:response regulator [Halobacterium hubeiense]CQH55056.1 receiver box response regulator [Halobacterium hubeiense]